MIDTFMRDREFYTAADYPASLLKMRDTPGPAVPGAPGEAVGVAGNLDHSCKCSDEHGNGAKNNLWFKRVGSERPTWKAEPPNAKGN